MSTLIEIEAAVDQLPYFEQEILLEHLARKLRVRPPEREGSQTQHGHWQEMLDDIRAEEC